jgi:hypothetical protein
MKSMFRKHYERKRRNNVAIKHPAIPVEHEVSVTVEKKSYAELDCVPSSGNNNVSENNELQIGSLTTRNENIRIQNGDGSNVWKQVAELRHQQMQPNVAAAECSAGPVEGGSKATAEGQLHTWSRRSASECHLPQTQRLTVLNESADCQKCGSSNVQRYTGDRQQDNMQAIDSKTFSRARFENEDVAHWKPEQDGLELGKSNSVRRQRNRNSAPTRSFAVVPKKVRIWDGE